jgi:uncharacterized protein YlbG (UPF0298 family)
MLPLDKIEYVKAELKKNLSLVNVGVMLYWRYFKPHKVLYVYLAITKGHDAKVSYYTAWYCNKKQIYEWVNKLKDATT